VYSIGKQHIMLFIIEDVGLGAIHVYWFNRRKIK